LAIHRFNLGDYQKNKQMFRIKKRIENATKTRQLEINTKRITEIILIKNQI
jgi:hypothetical protein|tara:strand:+ start:31521 stop:31673 length:153 start_codon:yes stop_codon:yes gene_type:complete